MEKDDRLLATVVRSAIGLLRRSDTLEAPVLSLIDRVLASESDPILLAAADALMSKPSAKVVGVLLRHLQKVKPGSQGILGQLDLAIIETSLNE